MTLAEALTHAGTVISAVPENAVRNGTPYSNTAVPTSTHVRERARWVIAEDGAGAFQLASLEQTICWMANLSGASTQRNALALTDRLDIEVATMMALGRAAMWRLFRMSEADLVMSECHILTAAEMAETIHNDYSAAVTTALKDWASFAGRLPGIAWYNALSFESCNHHHLPAKTKKLATTTIALLGMKEYFDAHTAEEAEGCVMHDMYHPVAYHLKSQLARNTQWAGALSAIHFDNLRKRVPVKAADCGVALNFQSLVEKARTYPHTVKDLPAALEPPTALRAAVATYATEVDPARVREVVADLRVMSRELVIPSVYVAGFILGRDKRSSDDVDLSLKEAAKTNTILGCPAYARGAAEHPGVFSQGVAAGWKKPSTATKVASEKLTEKLLAYHVAMAAHEKAVLDHSRLPPAGRPAAPVAPVRPVVSARAGAREWVANTTNTVVRAGLGLGTS
jgi:hypothetical protein